MTTTTAAPRDILGAIGNTPLVELRRVVPAGAGRVVLKLESANPTGSMKDRVARAMVMAAVKDGRLSGGGTVIEYTGGTTGVSVAFICAAMGYKSHFVYSDAFSNEKRVTMRAYGAEITDVKSEGGRITAPLIKAMIAKAGELSRKPGHWFCNQLENRDGEAGYHSLGDEMWAQAGRVDAFVQSVGSAHSIHGTATALRGHNAGLHVTAVEPAESSVLQGKPPGAHKIEGIGIGFAPPLWRRDEVDDVVGVSTDDANAMARRLAREEAIFGGTSTGANVIAAIEVARRLGAGATVGAIVIDSGLRYISTDAYKA
jgi:cysteine synthase